MNSSATPGPGSNVPPASHFTAPAPSLVSVDEIEKLVTFHKDVQSGLFSQSVAYHNVIVAAGYAGAFALWNVVKGQLAPGSSNWIVLSMGTSLLFFIAWNVFSMIWLAIERATYHETTANKVGEAYIKAYKAAERASLRRYKELYQPIWINQLVVTIVTAAIGVGILLVNVAANLLNT